MLRDRNKQRVMSRGRAEGIAADALAFIVADAGRLSCFLATTGLTVERLRRQAAGSAFLLAVLDYLMSDESLLLTFAATRGVAPAEIGPARNLLAAVALED